MQQMADGFNALLKAQRYCSPGFQGRSPWLCARESGDREPQRSARDGWWGPGVGPVGGGDPRTTWMATLPLAILLS